MKKLMSILLMLSLLCLCMSAAAEPLTDMMGREVKLEKAAQRIVALTASNVEILYAIGAGDTLVGRGEYCDYPEECLALPVVNSGAETNIEQILALQPDVVIMDTMAQTTEQVEALQNAGVAVVVEALTDNRNRTAGDVRHYFDKYGGNMGQTGSVMFMFNRQGVVLVDAEDVDEEEIMEKALEAGAEDVIVDDGVFDVRTGVHEVAEVADALTAAGYTVVSAQAEYVPSTYTRLEGDNITLMGKMLEMFEDNDDVQDVWHNWEMPEEE